MTGRLVTVGFAAFWTFMNVLLWRTEFGGGRQTVDDIPLDTVLDRVLSAADPSQLRLRHHTEEIGILRWMPAVVEAAPSTNDAAPEGMLGKLGGYHIDVDLNLTGDAPDRRWRALAQLDLATNRVWQEFHLRIIQRPMALELAARRGDDTVTVRFEDGRTARFEQRFTEKELLGIPAQFGPYFQLFHGGLDPMTLPSDDWSKASTVWTARNDTLRLGPHRLRVYRVSARWMHRYEVVAYFSRAGELLRVVLPDHYTLTNDAVTPR